MPEDGRTEVGNEIMVRIDFDHLTWNNIFKLNILYCFGFKFHKAKINVPILYVSFFVSSMLTRIIVVDTYLLSLFKIYFLIKYLREIMYSLRIQKLVIEC